jgi:hypothetical protein
MTSISFFYQSNYKERIDALKTIAPQLRDLGMRFVADDDLSADIPIIASNIYRQMESEGAIDPDRPVVIWERADQETVTFGNRELLRRANVVGWLKDHIPRRPDLHNEAHVEGYWHYGMIAGDAGEANRALGPFIQTTDIEKIACINAIPSYSRFDTFRSEAARPQKDIDVLMLGTVNYSHSTLDAHRKKAVEMVNRLRGLRVVEATGYGLSTRDYIDAIFRAKIIVSPFGYAMSSWKDWEARYAKTIVVKPDSTQQFNYRSDLFEKQGAWRICDPFFSDLQQAVEAVLDDEASHMEAVALARDAMLKAAFDLEARALDFYSLAQRWDIAARHMSNNTPGRAAGRRGPDSSVSQAGDVNTMAAPEKHANAGPSRQLWKGPVNSWGPVRAAFSRVPERWRGASRLESLPSEARTTHDARMTFKLAAGDRRVNLAIRVMADTGDRVSIWIGNRGVTDRVEAEFDLKQGRVTRTYGRADGFNLGSAAMMPADDGSGFLCVSANVPAGTETVDVMFCLADRNGDVNHVGDGGAVWLGPAVITTGEHLQLPLAGGPVAPPTVPPAATPARAAEAPVDDASFLAREYGRYFDEYPRTRECLGFHGDYYLARAMLGVIGQSGAFIETGSLSGDTTGLVARRFPGLAIHTCDANPRNYEIAKRRLSGHPNVDVRLDPSPGFLEHLFAEAPAIASRRPSFWLDAHGHDFKCPLADEVRIVSGLCPTAAIAIDDFKVPGRPKFGFDTYRDGISLTWEYIEPSLAAGTDYRIIQPAYDAWTSLHHPPRGWILILSGDWIDLPASLASLYESRTFRKN